MCLLSSTSNTWHILHASITPHVTNPHLLPSSILAIAPPCLDSPKLLSPGHVLLSRHCVGGQGRTGCRLTGDRGCHILSDGTRRARHAGCHLGGADRPVLYMAKMARVKEDSGIAHHSQPRGEDIFRMAQARAWWKATSARLPKKEEAGRAGGTLHTKRATPTRTHHYPGNVS